MHLDSFRSPLPTYSKIDGNSLFLFMSVDFLPLFYGFAVGFGLDASKVKLSQPLSSCVPDY